METPEQTFTQKKRERNSTNLIDKFDFFQRKKEGVDSFELSKKLKQNT